jgi:hypothetical protein
VDRLIVAGGPKARLSGDLGVLRDYDQVTPGWPKLVQARALKKRGPLGDVWVRIPPPALVQEVLQRD